MSDDIIDPKLVAHWFATVQRARAKLNIYAAAYGPSRDTEKTISKLDALLAGAMPDEIDDWSDARILDLARRAGMVSFDDRHTQPLLRFARTLLASPEATLTHRPTGEPDAVLALADKMLAGLRECNRMTPSGQQWPWLSALLAEASVLLSKDPRQAAPLPAEYTTGLDGWMTVKEDGMPDVGETVLGGLWHTDAWLKPEFARRFMFGTCRVFEESNRKQFPLGKSWSTFGPSHDQITHWTRITPPADSQEPATPKAQALTKRTAR